MIAIVGGLGAALLWAISTLASARSSRLLGASSVVAWATLLGLLMTLPITALSGPIPPLTGSIWVALAFAGIGNVVGLLLAYRGLRIGKIGIVAALASTEGAVAAVLAIVAGEPVTLAITVTLAVIVAGVVVVGLAAHDDSDAHDTSHPVDPAAGPRAIAFGAASAVAFGLGLYGSAQVGIALPIPYAVLPARVVGSVLVFLPMLVTGRLLLTREALPFVMTIAVVEVLGTASFALGARESIAISAVLASQFAAIAAIAAFVVFRERLSRPQRIGIVAIAVGVALLTGLRA